MNIKNQIDCEKESEMLTKSQGWLAKMPGLLRGFGAAAVLFSLYTFLFRGWEGSGDLFRYMMLLAHTGLLTIIALTSGYFFREGKSPRLLLMLSLVSVPVNFAILGAFIFSGMSDANPLDYPSFVAWSVGDLSAALQLSIAALVVLIPVIFIGFRALARGMSKSLSTLFVMGNLALLLPVRDPFWVLLMASGLGVYTLFVSSKTARQRTESKTFEGMISVLLQFLPVGILLGRNLWLYSPDLFVYTGILAMLFIALRHCSQFINGLSTWSIGLELTSVLVAIATGVSGGFALLNSGAPESIALLIGSAIAAGMTYEVAHRAKTIAELYRIIAVIILVAGVLLNLMVFGGLGNALVGLSVGLAGIIASHYLKQRSLFIGGVVLSFVGIVDLFIHGLQFFDFGYWVALVVVGVIAIVFASLLESSNNVSGSLYKYKQRYINWSY